MSFTSLTLYGYKCVNEPISECIFCVGYIRPRLLWGTLHSVPSWSRYPCSELPHTNAFNYLKRTIGNQTPCYPFFKNGIIQVLNVRNIRYLVLNLNLTFGLQFPLGPFFLLLKISYLLAVNDVDIYF